MARVALVRAGLQIFGANSLETASTREIARAAGMNSASVSYYFWRKARPLHGRHAVCRANHRAACDPAFGQCK
ncbi:TetR family transcriptional regulator [Undibacterium arcticum]